MLKSILIYLFSITVVLSALVLHNNLNNYEFTKEGLVAPLIVGFFFAKVVSYVLDLKKINEEKNLKIIEFVNVAIHDIRNPVSVINAILNLLKNKIENPDEKTSEYLEKADLMTTELLRITQELLQSIRFTDEDLLVETKAIPLSNTISLLNHFFQFLAEKKGIRIEVKNKKTQEISVLAHEKSLFDALSHIMSNAIKYSPKNSKISIEVIEKDKKVSIEITDSGPGIPADEVEKLFTKYGRLSSRPTGGEMSTGLGLYLTERLVKAMGGSCGARSANPGSTFWVELEKTN